MIFDGGREKVPFSDAVQFSPSVSTFVLTGLAAARSRRGSDSPPGCHSLPRRRFAALPEGANRIVLLRRRTGNSAIGRHAPKNKKFSLTSGAGCGKMTKRKERRCGIPAFHLQLWRRGHIFLLLCGGAVCVRGCCRHPRFLICGGVPSSVN